MSAYFAGQVQTRLHQHNSGASSPWPESSATLQVFRLHFSTVSYSTLPRSYHRSTSGELLWSVHLVHDVSHALGRPEFFHWGGDDEFDESLLVPDCAPLLGVERIRAHVYSKEVVERSSWTLYTRCTFTFTVPLLRPPKTTSMCLRSFSSV